jgi:hypothetical protein
MKLLLCLLIGSVASFANTNTILVPSIMTDNFDNVNIDMHQRYKLIIKPDNTLKLTGYTVQDTSSKLIKTYSVLRVEF